MKTIFLIVLFSIGLTGFSQVWFDLGIKGGVGSGFLINKTLSDDSRITINPGFNYFYGGKVGVNFGEMVGITADITYGKNRYGFNQAELLGSSTTYKYSIDYSAISVAPLFRFTKEASYLEVGPQFSFFRSGEVSNEASTINPTSPAETYLKNTTTKLIFGFGGHMIGNEIISLMLGLRFSYMLSNLTNDTYAQTTWPLSNYSDITGPAATHPFDAQIVLELNYSLGYFVRASCGRRTAFLTF